MTINEILKLADEFDHTRMFTPRYYKLMEELEKYKIFKCGECGEYVDAIGFMDRDVKKETVLCDECYEAGYSEDL